MTAKEYLRQLKRIDRQLENLLREREELEKAQTYMRSPQIDGDRVQTSPSGDPPWMGYLIKWEQITNRIGEKWDELNDLRETIINQINSLTDPRHIKILGMRYVTFKSFEQIAVDMGYSFEYTLRLHWEALKSFEDIM